MNEMVSSKISMNQREYELQLLKFNIVSKDQGWVRDCESGSWVEAEFIGGDNKNIKENQEDKNIGQNK